MVVRNAYSGSFESLTSETITITGLTSETSTTSVSIYKELSDVFLNSLYETIVDAGYSDAVMDAEEYSIIVLGFKFYAVVDTSYCSTIYCTPYGKMGGSIEISKKISSAQYDYMYNLTVRGDSNIIYITCGGYSSYDTENNILMIAKAKNLISNEDAYYFGTSFNSTYINENFIIDKKHNYQYIYESYMPSSSYTSKGLNTKTKYVCTPQLAYYDTYLIYSVIKGNSAIFTKGKYYKIGNEIYYCAGGSREYSNNLIKVE